MTYSTNPPDDMDPPNPYLSCKCGWSGELSDLEELTDLSDIAHCPGCGHVIWPGLYQWVEDEKAAWSEYQL